MILMHPSNHSDYFHLVASNLLFVCLFCCVFFFFFSYYKWGRGFVESPAGLGWSYSNTSSDYTYPLVKRIAFTAFSFKSILVCAYCMRLTVRMKNEK